MKLIIAVLIAVVVLPLAGCSTDPGLDKMQMLSTLDEAQAKQTMDEQAVGAAQGQAIPDESQSDMM